MIIYSNLVNKIIHLFCDTKKHSISRHSLMIMCTRASLNQCINGMISSS